jgi:GT2 family glycosyltransferase
MSADVGIVAIGRNEGERFKACLESLPPGLPAVYVDSGSTDGSVDLALAHGVVVVDLPKFPGFTAARARNAGWRRLIEERPGLAYVQFIDGDCALDGEWILRARRAMEADPQLAVVFGRRRERFPEASLYNAQCDREWDVPVGEVRACGGDALMRVAALEQAGGYCDGLIAGEEPDLCLRMRQYGWHIRRIEGGMTLHDAHIMRFPTWWKRARRAGHAYAEHVWRHRRNADPDWIRQMKSMAFWGAALPLLLMIGLVAALMGQRAGLVISFGVVALFVAQYARMVVRGINTGAPRAYAMGDAALMLVAKFAHLAGTWTFLVNRVRGQRSRIIEYK